MYSSSQYTSIIKINHKLICTIEFQPFWYTQTLIMAYFKPKLQSKCDRASPCSKPFLTGNMSDNSWLRGLCYTYKSDTFLLSLPFHVDTKLNGNITQDLLPNWIISFLEVYELYYKLLISNLLTNTHLHERHCSYNGG
jgi:hypothetical protein